ncbi:MAG: hypothetical protein GVY17_10135 [Cyanobacteria bacterium]|jgi:hypothetical protein|nr:hypothetical protein [Cyanobacteria bacterium GSL.Bin21]
MAKRTPEEQARLEKKAASLNAKEENFEKAGFKRIYWTADMVEIWESHLPRSG